MIESDVKPGAVPDGDSGKGVPRPKSTVRFPYYDLADAVKVVRIIGERAANDTCAIDQLARYLDHKSVDSGAFRLRLAAGSMFGLLDPDSGHVRLTERARAILSMHPEDHRRALVESFLDVELFRKVYEQYQGRQLPPDAGLKNVLREMGVVPNQVDRAFSTLMRSADEAGFRASGERYFVAPSVTSAPTATDRATVVSPSSPSVAQPTASTAQQPQASTGGGASPPPTGIHPALMGLLQLLPPAQTRWRRGKQDWLAAFTATVNAIYPDRPDGDDEDEVLAGERLPSAP